MINLIVILIDINIRKQNSKNAALNFLNIVEQKCQDEIYDVYILLLNANDNIKDEKILNQIFSKFKDSNNYIETSILLLIKIKDDNKKKKYFNTLKGYTFEFKDFFTKLKDNEIKFYITLNEKNLIDKDSNSILNEISKKIIKFEIEKSNIESFLELTENQKLERLKLISPNSKEIYEKIKVKNEDVNKEINDIKILKDLSVYISF